MGNDVSFYDYEGAPTNPHYYNSRGTKPPRSKPKTQGEYWEGTLLASVRKFSDKQKKQPCVPIRRLIDGAKKLDQRFREIVAVSKTPSPDLATCFKMAARSMTPRYRDKLDKPEFVLIDSMRHGIVQGLTAQAFALGLTPREAASKSHALGVRVSRCGFARMRGNDTQADICARHEAIPFFIRGAGRYFLRGPIKTWNLNALPWVHSCQIIDGGEESDDIVMRLEIFQQKGHDPSHYPYGPDKQGPGMGPYAYGFDESGLERRPHG